MPQPRRPATALGQIGAHHRQQHPEGEQVGEPRQPVGHRRRQLGVPLQHPDPVGEADRDQTGQADQLHLELGRRGPAAVTRPGPGGTPAAHQRRPPGEHQVEGHLRAQGPRLGDAGQHVVGQVDLGEAQVDGQGPPGVMDGVAVQPVADDDEGHPVGGDDAPQPPGPEAARRRCRTAAEMGDREGAVQEKPGDHEEDRHADLQPGRVTPEPAAAGEAGHEGGVHPDDRYGRERPQTVEARVSRRGLGRLWRGGADERNSPDAACVSVPDCGSVTNATTQRGGRGGMSVLRRRIVPPGPAGPISA